MLAQTLEDACGQDPNSICRFSFEQTDNDSLAWFTSRAVMVLLIGLLAWLTSRVIKRQIPRAAEAYIDQREEDDAKNRRVDLTEEQVIARDLRLERARLRARTMGSVIASFAVGVVWFIGSLLVLDQMGLNLAPLLAGAGVVGIALGFGAQQVVKDFLAGMFIVFEDQYGAGDVVDLGDAVGTVERISLRVTKVRDVRGTVWYVPNGEIRRVGNLSKLWSRAVLDVDVSYDSDIDAAGQLMRQAATGLWQDRLPEMTIIGEPEFWGVERFGADGVTLRLAVRTEPSEQFQTARELRRRIKAAFDDAGIEIPFPQRTVWLQQGN